MQIGPCTVIHHGGIHAPLSTMPLQVCIAKAQSLRAEIQELRQHCEKWCALPPGSFPALPLDAVSSTVP